MTLLEFAVVALAYLLLVGLIIRLVHLGVWRDDDRNLPPSRRSVQPIDWRRS
jgi:hypothetical protein